MEKIEKLRRKLSLSLISIIAVASLLLVAVFSTYAWFTTNSNAIANGFALKLQGNVMMTYEKTVYATRHRLDGARIVNEYTTNSKGILMLENSTLYEKDSEEGIENKENENPKFLFEELTPGEYVDITFAYYLENPEDDYIYKLQLGAFNSSGTFNLSANGISYTHSILGIFKYRPLSLKTDYLDGSESTLLDFSIDDYPYTWMTTYNAFKNDEIPAMVDLLNNRSIGVFSVGSKRQEFSFRISEDLTQYYKLVNDSGTFATNLLSHLTFNVGSILMSEIDN